MLRGARGEREVDVERADGECPAELQRDLQCGAVRLDVGRPAVHRAAPLRLGAQRAGQRSRDRGRKEGNELGEMRRVERRRHDIVGGGETRAAAGVELGRTGDEGDVHVAKRVARDGGGGGARECDAGKPAGGRQCKVHAGAPRRREHARRRNVRIECARRKGAESRGVEAAGVRIEDERALAGEADATVPGELAPRRGKSKAFDVDRFAGNRCGEMERDAARDGAIADVAADLLAAAVEIGSDRSGEPRCHERRIDRPEIEVGDGERPRARAVGVERNPGRSGGTAAARELRRKIVERERARAPRKACRQPAQRDPAGVERAGQQVGRLDAAGDAAATYRLRACDDVEPRRGQCLVPRREIERGGIDGDRDQRHLGQRRERRMRRESRAACLAVAVHLDRGKRARQRERCYGILDRGIASECETSVDREGRVTSNGGAARQCPRLCPELEVRHPTAGSPAGIAQGEAADRAAVRADAPIETGDRELLDGDFERQRETRRQRHVGIRRFEIELDVFCAKRLHDDPARPQRGRAPRQRDIGRRNLRRGTAPDEPTHAHGVQQRARCTLDGEVPAAAKLELAHGEFDADFAREKDVRGDRQCREERSHCQRNARPTAWRSFHLRT